MNVVGDKIIKESEVDKNSRSPSRETGQFIYAKTDRSPQPALESNRVPIMPKTIQTGQLMPPHVL